MSDHKEHIEEIQKEMDSYLELFDKLHLKLEKEVTEKKEALDERDKAVDQVKTIRQKYINILEGSKNEFVFDE